MVDATAILDLHRDALLAHGQHEVHLRFAAALRKVGHRQMVVRLEQLPGDAFGQSARNVRQMRCSLKRSGFQRYHLLQPCGPQRVVGKNQFGRAFAPFQAQFQGFDQAYEQRGIEKLQVGQHALPSDVGIQRATYFIQVNGLGGGLADIAATEAEHLLQQGFVASASALAHSQVVLYGSSHHRIDQLCSDLIPAGVGPRMRQGISSAFGEPGKSLITKSPVGLAEGPQIFPEPLFLHRPQAVKGQVGR
ncbi:MAG: hypothetical protein FGM40_09500 [Rhodocyclaceae bacterium]|nr:hypothetical protein [Rhodocyclaceae bacterium]